MTTVEHRYPYTCTTCEEPIRYDLKTCQWYDNLESPKFCPRAINLYKGMDVDTWLEQSGTIDWTIGAFNRAIGNKFPHTVGPLVAMLLKGEENGDM